MFILNGLGDSDESLSFIPFYQNSAVAAEMVDRYQGHAIATATAADHARKRAADAAKQAADAAKRAREARAVTIQSMRAELVALQRKLSAARDPAQRAALAKRIKALQAKIEAAERAQGGGGRALLALGALGFLLF